jgi:cyanophycinase
MTQSAANESSTFSSRNATILVIGGAEDKVHGREILRTFFEHSGGIKSRIAIIPSASREPEAIGSRYRTIFGDMGAQNIQVLDIRERYQSEDPIWQNYLDDCTGVFITGGDQLRLCSLLADTPLMEKLLLLVQRGEVTLAGTSAGAAIMGHHMIAGGGSAESPNRSLVDMTTGLGFLPQTIVDQHFHNRNRMARLISAVSCHPDRIGIGIDEDTCAMFEGHDTIQVVGKGTVTIVDPGEMSYTNAKHISSIDPISIFNLRLHVLTHGDRFNLPQRAIELPEQQQMSA